MGYTIDWGSAEVQEGQLSVRVRPDPDFAFLKVFDMVLIESPPPPGAAAWGQVQFASGRIVVSEVQPGSAPALEHFLDGAVREADQRVGAERERLERQAGRERQAAEEKRRTDDAATAASERRDEQPRRSSGTATERSAANRALSLGVEAAALARRRTTVTMDENR